MQASSVRHSIASTRGETQIWLSGAALAVILLSVFGLLAIVCINGLGLFWPSRLIELSGPDGTKFLGEITATEQRGELGDRTQLRIGNRDLYGSDFVWLDNSKVPSRSFPAAALSIERLEWGPFFGFPVELKRPDMTFRFPADGTAGDIAEFYHRLDNDLAQSWANLAQIRTIEQEQMGKISRNLERLRLERNRSASDFKSGQGQSAPAAAAIGAIDHQILILQNEFHQYELEVIGKRKNLGSILVVADVNGTTKELPLEKIVDYYQANQISFRQRIGRYCLGVWRFITGDPRESNTEGGVFPAIYGTVLMVILMSLITTPLGVVTALYLREYSRQGPFVSFVRICVSNLAGVPSIVYGVFGLGFFVYFIGAGIDQTFYSESLPTPTFGTGGILWASLTLALLTLPTVIVTAEEGLAALPRHLREASYALGATKAETVIKVILPALSPAILTGVILATARAAGEVAPLMLTGVVKLAPELPIDGQWPFFHFDRKFMHLGFHIFDVGFQSPNVEAARPMVFATTVLLLIIVVLLNVTAVRVRAKLRKKYSSSAI